MQVGDLVEFTSVSSVHPPSQRGIVLRFDVYHPEDYGATVPIVEVLCETGPRWVNQSKVKVIDDTG